MPIETAREMIWSYTVEEAYPVAKRLNYWTCHGWAWRASLVWGL